MKKADIKYIDLKLSPETQKHLESLELSRRMVEEEMSLMMGIPKKYFGSENQKK